METRLAPWRSCRRLMDPPAFDAADRRPRTEGGGLIADLDPGWDVGGGILNGGYLLSVAAQAAVLESPHPHPVALSASYLRAPAAGPVTLTVVPGSVRPDAGPLAGHSADADGPALTIQATTATLGSGAVGLRPPDAGRPPGRGVLLRR